MKTFNDSLPFPPPHSIPVDHQLQKELFFFFTYKNHHHWKLPSVPLDFRRKFVENSSGFLLSNLPARAPQFFTSNFLFFPLPSGSNELANDKKLFTPTLIKNFPPYRVISSHHLVTRLSILSTKAFACFQKKVKKKTKNKKASTSAWWMPLQFTGGMRAEGIFAPLKGRECSERKWQQRRKTIKGWRKIISVYVGRAVWEEEWGFIGG